MKHKRCSALILATALMIIGMRGVCMAEFSYHLSSGKADTRSVKVGRGGFNCRVKRYIYRRIAQITQKASV
jgi:hypothetical protein